MVLLGSALVLIVILLLVPERSFNRARDAEQLVTHTLRVLNASGALLTVMEDAETGERGYLLTGEERYLQPYQSALSNYRQASRNLRQLTVGDSVRQARLDELDRLVETKLASLSGGIALYRTKGRDAALALVFMGEGKLAMDEIRVLSRDMAQEEQRLLIIRTQAAVEAQDTQLKWILRIGGALLLMMIAVAGVITERVIGKHERVAVALQASEERFRTLADAIPQLCWTANADGWIFWYNQRWYDFTGKTPREMEGWGWQSVHDPAALPVVLAGWKKAIASGEPFEMVFRLRAADGAFHPFLTRVMPVHDANGQVVRWFGTNTDITGQRQIEVALAENQERLRLAQEVARIGTFVWNLQTGESQLTPELEAMYGLPPGGFAAGHRTWQDLICPEDRDQGVLYVQEAMEKGSFAAEWRVIWPDGTTRWLFGRAWVSKDETGRPLRLMGANTDVTERKLAELEVLRIKVDLAENQERLRLAQEVARIGTFEWNLQTGVNQLTPELEVLYGLPPGGFAGGNRTWQDLICPEDRDQGLLYVQEAMEKGSFAAEWRVIWPDGTTHWLFGRAWVSKDETGKPLRLMGANTDITERKLVELELLRVNADLAENQERLRLAQEVARIGTFVWNLQTGESQLTPELEAMYGLPPGGFVAGSRTWQDLICPEDREQGVQYVHEVMETGSFEAEWRVIWPDGTTHWLFGRAWVSKDDTGKPLRLVGANIDITERKLAELEVGRLNAELEQRVRQRTLELEASNRELEAFAYSVSHDLRAPLRGIDGWSLALLEDYSGSLDDNGRHYLNRVRTETQRMGNLIDDLLQLSRASRGEMKLDEVDITALADRIVARLRDALPQRRMEFVIEPGLVAFGDSRLLEIALTNLISNAVKFTGTQNPALIEFGKVDKEGEMAFYVRDNGAGFDMAYAGNLFGAFQRLHKVSEYPGTGIGLATVQRIVRRHGGRVWADARVNRGATFSFTLGAA
jgi:PAS domain S-box-containing protein